MSGDYTRFTFDPRRDHSGVLMQQGRVMLDADFNELVELIDRRLRAETMDIIGRCVVPAETPDGFLIQVTGGGVITIGPGRMYVDGLLAENHGGPPLAFDLSTEEQRGTAAVAYEDQPYLPDAATLLPAPTDGGPFLIYADVWKREVTPTEDLGIVEKAVGVDSATRTQTVWQVKAYPPPGSDEQLDSNTSCDTPDGDVPGWLDFTAPSAGRLTTEGQGVPSIDDPCVIPPNGGYRGTENRLYRVEIHDPGGLGAATFKWSRDNASVATTVTAIDTALTQLTVVRTARDAVLRFSTDDWVEVTDDHHELYGRPGVMRKVLTVDDVAQTITLTAALPAGEFDATDPARHTRVKRWDQKGIVRDASNNQVDDVDASGGVITVPAGGTTLVLEDGIQVTFSTDPVGGSFRSGDYWVFAARTVDASVEELDAAPPRGIHHHYCRLAVVTLPQGTPQDCRVLWPPPFGGGGCDCDVCVTAESHNNGQLTIQHALDQVRDRGGRVCLGPGLYRLEAPLQIAGARSVELRGKGWTTILMHLGAGPVIEVQRSLGVSIEEMTLVSSAVAPQTHTSAAYTSLGGFGIALLNNVDVTIRRCAITELGSTRPTTGTTTVTTPAMGLLSSTGPAIAIAGFLIKGSIVENVLAAGFGVLGIATADPKQFTVATVATRAGYVATADLAIEDNIMLCGQAGIAFPGLSAHLAETRFAGNLIGGCRVGGILALGAVVGRELAASHLDIRGNTLRALGDAIAVGTDDTRIEDNDAAGAAKGFGGDGIVLAPGAVRSAVSRVTIRGNRLTGLGGMGIALRVPVSSAEIAANVIQDASRGGIVMAVSAAGGDVAVLGNRIQDVGPLEGSEGTDTAGILVAGAGRAQIVDNSMVGVATNAVEGASRVGIQVIGTSSARIAGNDVVDVGPEGEFVNDGVGIDVVAPFDRLDVVDNVIRRSTLAPAKPDGSRWWAVRIRPVEVQLVSPVGVLVKAATDFVLISADAVTRLPRGREVLGVRGNLADGYGIVPALQIKAGGACVVSENRCLLATDKAVVIDLTGGAAIVGGNYLEGMATQIAMTVAVGNGPFTVLGNITSGQIEVNGASLAAPWAQLNTAGI